MKMSKQRTSTEKKDDAVRRPKVTRSFKLGDKWYNIDGSEYNTIGKLQWEIHSNPMKSSEDDMKEQLKNMTSELCTYKERVSLMESNDKKVIVYSLCISCIDFFIWYEYFYIWYYIQRYGRFGRYMGDFECYVGDFGYIITNLVLINYF